MGDLLGNCEYRRIVTAVGAERDQLVGVILADLEGDGIVSGKEGLLDGRLDIEADGSGVFAAKGLYRVGQGRIAGVAGFVKGLGRVARQQRIIDEIQFGDGVCGGLRYVDFEAYSGQFGQRVDVVEVKLDVVFVHLVVIRVGFVFDDDLNIVEGEEILSETVVIDVVGDELDVVCPARIEVGEGVGVAGNEPAIRSRGFAAAAFRGNAVAHEIQIITGGIGRIYVPACERRIDLVHDDVVLHSDFQRFDVARGQFEAVLHRDVFTDSADSVVRFEVAGVVFAGQGRADQRCCRVD